MKHLWLVAMVLWLGGCQGAVAPQAAGRANLAQTAPAIPPAVSRPIVEPEGNVVQCTAYPGPGAANACIQK